MLFSLFIFFQIKMSERLKLRRKRIGGSTNTSSSYQPTNRVNKFLSQAIEARSVDREKANHVNLFSLCFRDPEKERQVNPWKIRQRVFKVEVDMSVFVWLSLAFGSPRVTYGQTLTR